MFLFNGYDLNGHVAFYTGNQEEARAPNTNETKTAFMFLPSSQVVVLFNEINTDDNEEALGLLHTAPSRMQTDVQQFLQLHHQHLVGGQVTIIPLIVAPHLQRDKFTFHPCCDECESITFFKEDLSDESHAATKWQDIKEHKLKKYAMQRESRRGFEQMLAHIIGYMSIVNVCLPSPTDDAAMCAGKLS